VGKFVAQETVRITSWHVGDQKNVDSGGGENSGPIEGKKGQTATWHALKKLAFTRREHPGRRTRTYQKRLFEVIEARRMNPRKAGVEKIRGEN